MTLAVHQWVRKYAAPLPMGQTITGGMSGRQIALAITEIQKTINAIKIDDKKTAHQWIYPCSVPFAGQIITQSRPGLLYARAITEIQDTIDGMSGLGPSDSLILAYSEHRQAIGQGAYLATPPPEGTTDVSAKKYQWLHRYTPPVAGRTIKDTTPGFNIAQAITEIQGVITKYQMTHTDQLENEMQNWLETYCALFIDHVSGPLASDGSDFKYLTLASWRTIAGIDGTWKDGDLEKGFRTLSWLPFFRDIANVRNTFPVVTGRAIYVGLGSGASFGVYYPFDGTNPSLGIKLGGSGTYNIVLDANKSLGGTSGYYYIALGKGNNILGASVNGGGLILDTSERGGPKSYLVYSASLTFADDMVEVYGCRNAWQNYPPIIISSSFSSRSVNVTALLDESIGAATVFDFFPVIKVPFTKI